MTRRKRMPRPGPVRSVPAGWGAIIPVVSLCALALASAVLAFNGRSGTGVRSDVGCLNDSIPGTFETWEAFFRRYPIDDAFLKARIRTVNGSVPGKVITVPLDANSTCGEASSDD